jgi:hypothetical protein
MLGGALKGDGPKDNPVVQMLKNVNTVALSAGEKGDQVRAELKLGAPNEDTAKEVKGVAQGFVSILTLLKDNPGAQKLAKSLDTVQNGGVVTVNLKLPVAEIIQMMKDAESKKKKQE